MQKNPDNLHTAKVSNYTACGYSRSTVCAFDDDEINMINTKLKTA